ncbi:Mg chelatase, subunit ChlI [Desulfofarcimen acetoxidans DSM 771]|uniref:Mg chelatase, subunit ChlI n=1 Tax=Desulfofarcimen acetoxidans (strain ATCC 49208 / DSM 771 / KCTC 5769 / VKM B-1644 / 5575) TaxID=485916 RepID=C8VYM9_DESAS|nr:YifB family Mg chelatase-like AAA ATPase [Desulfofarcimen acetoxidans]ACV64750.1 Mg chelatase, subunit ChlI [Desulfofarcimen acetoxidans DSM 771]
MAVVVRSFAIAGVDGYLVDVETMTLHGQPVTAIVGLGDAAVKEARQRLESAITCAQYEFPKMKIVINLAPSSLKKSGSHFDLAMAIGLLIQSGQLTVPEVEQFGFIGELSLNADLRPCIGILPMAVTARNKGIRTLIVSKENIKEASVVKDINVLGFSNLQEVVNYLNGSAPYVVPDEVKGQDSVLDEVNHCGDFQDVKGQDTLLEYVVVAAAGGHNILMIGAPGCGKSMIAKRIPTILPSLSDEEAIEITKVYSVAGLLKDRNELITRRLFRAPHHNASLNSLIGGGSPIIPGEISLAHNGVLFLDEIAEFNKKTLDALRQPMEDKQVTISRVKSVCTFPSNFMLVAAMNPCPCGYYGQDKCRCSDYEVLKYRQKLSGPILDRIDLQKYVQSVDFLDLSGQSNVKSSAQLRERVEFARQIQQKRYVNTPGVNCNAQMTEALVKEFCLLEEDGKRLMRLAHDKFKYSARTFNKFLKVARTFADLEGSRQIRKQDIAAALMSRDLDKDRVTMLAI